MESLPSRSELRRELKRRGMPRAYIARLLAELDDHFTDLLEERNTSMGAARKLQFDTDADEAQQRLGEPTQLAIFAAEKYHDRSFFGRHPLLTFLIGPLPLLMLGWFVVGTLLIATGVVIQAIDYVSTAVFDWSLASIPEENHPFVQAVLLACVSWALLVVPPLMAGWFLCRVAARNSLNWKWPTLGCGLLATVAALGMVSYRIKTIDTVGTLMLGFNYAPSTAWILTMFIPRFAVAMCIGLLLVKRAQQRAEIAV